VSSSGFLLKYFIFVDFSWDKSRHRAAELLRKFPRPLPGFETYAAVGTLVSWGCLLADSSRLREADAGTAVRGRTAKAFVCGEFECQQVVEPYNSRVWILH